MIPSSDHAGAGAGADRPAAPSLWRDRLLLLALAAGLLLAVWLWFGPRLSFSDEAVYAVIGRNVAAGRGLVAGHYHPDSILEKGYPSLYVHMPGHPLLLAASFRLLGAGELAAFVPSGLSYAAVALLLYGLGRRLRDRFAGWTAALFFLFCPLVLSLASTVMSELSLCLLTVGYLALWLAAWREPRWWWGPALALGLAAGVAHHETFLAFLPATAILIGRAPAGDRLRLAASSALSFALLGWLVLWPLHQARAPHPHFAAGVLASGGPAAVASAMAGNLLDNVLDLVRSRGGGSGTLRTQLPYLAMTALLLAWRRFDGPARALLLFTASGFAMTFLGLAPLYPLVKVGPRPLLHLAPPMCLLAGLLLASLRPRRAGVALASVALAVCALFSWRDVAYMMRSQSRSYAAEAGLSRLIRAQTRGLQPRGVLAEGAFLYAWDAWPVTVVPFVAGLDGAGFDRLSRRLPIDVIALRGLPVEAGEPEPPPLASHLRQRGYASLGQHEGLWFFERSGPDAVHRR